VYIVFIGVKIKFKDSQLNLKENKVHRCA